MSEESARDAILRLVRAARPELVGLPDVKAAVTGFPEHAGDPRRRFMTAAGAAGAHVVEGGGGDLPRLVAAAAAEARRVLSSVAGLPSTIVEPSDPHALSDLDLYVGEAAFGVAENGAVWLAESRTANRAALFLATSVVIVLDARSIVADLHAAYDRIGAAPGSFGLFLAGPSKTADIEQSLVIGAHGPKQLTLLLVARAD